MFEWRRDSHGLPVVASLRNLNTTGKPSPITSRPYTHRLQAAHPVCKCGSKTENADGGKVGASTAFFFYLRLLFISSNPMFPLQLHRGWSPAPSSPESACLVAAQADMPKQVDDDVNGSRYSIGEIIFSHAGPKRSDARTFRLRRIAL